MHLGQRVPSFWPHPEARRGAENRRVALPGTQLHTHTHTRTHTMSVKDMTAQSQFVASKTSESIETSKASNASNANNSANGVQPLECNVWGGGVGNIYKKLMAGSLSSDLGYCLGLDYSVSGVDSGFSRFGIRFL